MPPHDHYYEPFLGSGQIMRRKHPVLTNIGFDMDGEAVKRFNETAPDHMKAFKGSMLGNLDVKGESVLIYCDPPYLLSTRTSHHRYKYDWSDDQHIEFLKWALMLDFWKCKVMISTYPNDIYPEYLNGWRFIDFTGPTRGGPRTERLYMNYPEGQLFSTTYAGENRDIRQRIKRKAQRWQDKYKAMSICERQAILGALLAIDNSQG